jgi:hypothetical protein
VEGGEMINEEGVRKELSVLKLTVPESCKYMISLAESWLARKWPDKKRLSDKPITMYTEEYFLGWNAAIDACRLANIVSEEELYQIIKENSGEAAPNTPFGWRRYIACKIAEYVNKGGENDRNTMR